MGQHDRLAERIFDQSDQARFARFSGDINPMHMDEVAARRTQAGAPVVHGMHLLLWALEVALPGRGGPWARLTARFERFLTLGSPVELFAREVRGSLRLELRSGERRLTQITVERGEPDPVPSPGRRGEAIPSKPLELDLAAAAAAAGAFSAPPGEPDAFGFAQAAAALGPERVRALAALSTLVGMMTPGLHSILASVEVQFTALPAEGRETLAYRGVSAHEAFSLVALTAHGGGVRAEIEAFLRPAPVKQPSLEALRARVPAGAYHNVRALVIGGSRGLGELAAKLVAAGGGQVAITYAKGAQDAASVAAQIRSIGQPCDVLAYDAAAAAAPQLEALSFRPTQIYYFATPRIFRQRTRFYSRELLDEYTRIYCDGFFNVCEAYSGGAPVRIFYPSSVAVEERPRDLTEYAMAKSASEALCADIDRDLASVSVIMARLPRLETDQTATLTPVESASAAAVMADLVAQMSAA